MTAMGTDSTDDLLAVLFDWDGTLADSAEATYRCYAQVFSGFGIGFDRPTFQATYSPDWYCTYRAVGLPESRWAEADARWVESFAAEPVRLLPGAHRALLRVRSRGLRQALVTSGTRRRVVRDIEYLGVGEFFETVVCAEDSLRRKPEPDPLLRALASLGVSPQRAVYLGDSPEDVQMARAAGVRAVGIPGGFPNRERLEAAAPDLLAPSLEVALDAILDASGETSKSDPRGAGDE
jgi:HAD superfamily hydrolase (TIGR01509 family)